MALHALRELNGILLDFFVPVANVIEDPCHAAERQRVAHVLAKEGFSKDVIQGAEGRLPPGAKDKISAVCRLLALDAEIEETWRNLKLHTVAHRRSLGMRTITDPEVVATFAEAERVLAAVAGRWTHHYPAWFALVDDIATARPSKANAKRLLKSVPPTHELLSRFFRSIDQPQWLSPLRAQGLLTRVPAAEFSDDGTTVRYLPWPAAPFLAAVSEQVPQGVKPVLDEVATSDNPLALHAVIGIASKLPVDLAATLVDAIADGVVRWRGVHRPPDLVGDLILHLLSGSAHDNALRLASRVLALDGPDHVGGDHPQEYQRLLAEVVHALDGVGPDRLLSMLFTVLRDASGTGRDRSVVWLPRVDGTAPRHDDNRPVVAAKITRLIERLTRGGDFVVLGSMMASGVPAVQRIALHLARVHAAINPMAVLQNMSVLVDEELRVEVGELVRDRWDDIGGEAATRYVEFISAGPPAELLENVEGTEHYVRKWRGLRLQPILDRLDTSDAWVADLLTRADIPAHDVLQRHVFRARMAEPVSPWSAEDLLALDDDALVNRIKEFAPGAGVDAPSHRGIGKILAVVVAQDVQRYGNLSQTLSDMPAEILHGAIAGVAQAARREPIDWDVVLGAARAGIGWSGTTGAGWDDFEQPLRALRHQSLAAIGARLRYDELLPDEVVLQVTKAVETCLADKEPRDNDPWLTLGPVGELPHTVRNVALNTLVDLTSTVGRTGDVSNSVVGAALRDALQRETNAYVVAQAARRVHRLAADAPGWLRDHLDLVFGDPGSDATTYRVAWQTMSFHDAPDGLLATLLAPHYIAWIEGLTGQPLDEYGRGLAAHVGALAAARVLSSDIVERFFAVAPIDGRSAALGCAAPAADDQVDTARLLWEQRAAAVEAGDNPEELRFINAWLDSELLPPAWLLDQLDLATRHGTPIDRGDVALFHLLTLASAVPEAGDVVLDILERLLAQSAPEQLEWSSQVILGIIECVAEARDDLHDRVSGARATAALRLQDPRLLIASAD